MLATLLGMLAWMADPASIPLPPHLDQVLRNYERAWRAKDHKAVAALFSPDGYALPDQSKPAQGATAIAAAYQGQGGPLFLRAFAFQQSKDLAVILGAYTYNNAANPDLGKFTLTLKRVNRKWLIYSDMDNALSPKPATAPNAN